MELPTCPVCKLGRLLPMETHSFWVCSAPECTYVVSANPTPAIFYKGNAVAQAKENAGKRWIEFEF